MAANPSIFHDGEIQYVFYKMFSKGGNNHTPMCVRAPFSVVKQGGKNFIMPTSTGVDGAGLYATDEADEAYYQAREDFGFVSAEILLIEEHEMGDHVGHPNDWKGLHAFSMI